MRAALLWILTVSSHIMSTTILWDHYYYYLPFHRHKRLIKPIIFISRKTGHSSLVAKLGTLTQPLHSEHYILEEGKVYIAARPMHPHVEEYQLSYKLSPWFRKNKEWVCEVKDILNFLTCTPLKNRAMWCHVQTNPPLCSLWFNCESQFLDRLIRSPGVPKEKGVWNSQGGGKDKCFFPSTLLRII